MSTQNDGGPAFPETRWDDKTRQEVQWCGMSLRMWLAGQALCGWAAGRNNVGFIEGSNHEQVAASCFKYADAMIQEGLK